MISTRSGFWIAALVLSSSTVSRAQSQQTAPPSGQTAAPATPAQDAAPAAPESAVPTSAPQRQNLSEELVVTGSRLRRKDLTTPAPVTVVTRQQFETSGKMTIGDYLQTMPENGNAANFQLNTGGINYGADGTTQINLRSLGSRRTLVLINGRRVVPSGLGASSAVDLNTIPTEAVDRIEILKDGGSAVYGSDAIAGVVNIITRKNYSGTDLGAQYGVSGHGDAQTFDAHVTTGTSNDTAGAMFSVRYMNQGDSWLRDRTWSQQALDFDYTGSQCDPGVLRCPVPSGSSRVPEGALTIPGDANGKPICNGNALCLAMVGGPNGTTWSPTKRWIRDPNGPFCGANPAGQMECFRVFNTPAPANNNSGNDFYNFAAQNYLTIPSTTVQGYSSGEAKFSPARGYYELSYTQRSVKQNAAPMPLNPGDYANIVYSKDSIYNPLGTNLDFLGRRLVEFGNRTYSEDLATFRVVTGLDGTLPEAAGPLQGWFWDAALNYGRTSGTFTTGGSFRNSRVASAVGASGVNSLGQPVCLTQAGADPNDPANVIAGCTPLNLLGGPGSIAQSQQDYLGFTGTSRAFDELLTAGLSAGGDLFKLAADRPASLALGYEYRRQLGSQIADPIAATGDSADFNFTSTSGGMYSNEAFAELSLPIFANLPGVEALEASAAARYVNYNTFGGNFTYKLGARYSPIRDLTVRGTYSTAFRAPSISELYLGNKETDPAATDPCANFATASATVVQNCQTKGGVTGAGSGDGGLQELTRTGGTATLQPETAKTFTAGLVIQPQAIRNLSFTIDYFNITIDDAIGLTGTANILNGCYVNGVDDYCALVVRNDVGKIQYVNDFYANVGRIRTAGVDFSVRYALPTQAGRFAFGFDGSYLAFYDSTIKLQGGPVTVHGADTYDAGSYGALPRFKATSGLDWSMAGATLGLLGHYVASFDECANPYDNTTAQGGICELGNTSAAGPLRRRVSSYFQLDLHAGYTLTSTIGKTGFFVGINNLLDTSPPYIYSAALANSDPATYDYVGRYVYGRVQHSF